jgi:hypothetical protein
MMAAVALFDQAAASADGSLVSDPDQPRLILIPC